MNVVYRNKTFTLAFFSGILFILLQIFRWELFDLFFFFELFLEFIVAVLFIISLIFSIINIFRNKKKQNKKVYYPLLINCLTIIIITFVPFTNIILNIDFSLNKNAREEVVHSINSGVIKPNITYNPHLIHLPYQYKGLSKGGDDVIFDKSQSGTAVFFFTFRGILDSFSGFAYCPKPNQDCTSKFIDKQDTLQVNKIDDHWYWLASHYYYNYINKNCCKFFSELSTELYSLSHS